MIKKSLETDEGYCSRKVSVESTGSSVSTDSGLSTSPDSAQENEPPEGVYLLLNKCSSQNSNVILGYRVVLGRETSPEIQNSSALPEDVIERFRGQTREVLLYVKLFFFNSFFLFQRT